MLNGCCTCPSAWRQFVDSWVYVYVLNSPMPFGDSQWQLIEVENGYIEIRRSLGAVCWQEAVVRCADIVALVEAIPEP